MKPLKRFAEFPKV